jgi:hypothetical protein
MRFRISSTMNGRVLPSSPGRTCAPRQAPGAWRTIFPTCRRGSSSRSVVQPCTGRALRCAFRSTSSRRAAPMAASPAPTCSTGLSRLPRWNRGTRRPRTRWARRGPMESRGCQATTTTKYWKPERASSATRKFTPGTCRSTASREMAAARASRSASASRAASPAASGRRCTRRFQKARRPATWRCGRMRWRCTSSTMHRVRSPA